MPDNVFELLDDEESHIGFVITDAGAGIVDTIWLENTRTNRNYSWCNLIQDLIDMGYTADQLIIEPIIGSKTEGE